jgi:hypothetical protein
MDWLDYITALGAAAVVMFLVGKLLIAAFFAARRRHLKQTLQDLTKGEYE